MREPLELQLRADQCRCELGDAGDGECGKHDGAKSRLKCSRLYQGLCSSQPAEVLAERDDEEDPRLHTQQGETCFVRA